jgi:hypothetical protein
VLTDFQQDVLKGTLLGNASIVQSGKISSLYFEQKNKEYIESMFAIHPLQKGATDNLKIYVYIDEPITKLLEISVMY